MPIKVQKAVDFTARRAGDLKNGEAFKFSDGTHGIRVTLCGQLEGSLKGKDIPYLFIGGLNDNAIGGVGIMDADRLVEPLIVEGTLKFSKTS